jgi:Na+/H+ antiporter NhaD/arsenite permease-like protein
LHIRDLLQLVMPAFVKLVHDFDYVRGDFGAGFGGNGTIIGSTANIVVVSLSEKTRTPITAVIWSKRGLPVMILACIVSSLLYALFFPWFAR